VRKEWKDKGKERNEATSFGEGSFQILAFLWIEYIMNENNNLLNCILLINT